MTFSIIPRTIVILAGIALALPAFGCAGDAAPEDGVAASELGETSTSSGTHRLTKVVCDGGAAVVTYDEYFDAQGQLRLRDSTRLEVKDRAIVDYLRGQVLTFENVGADLPADYSTARGGIYFGVIDYPTAPYYFFAQSQPRDDGGLVVEGVTLRRSEGHGCGSSCAGRVEVYPGFAAHFEGAGLKVSFTRKEDRDFGVTARYLGDWYFQSCVRGAPELVSH